MDKNDIKHFIAQKVAEGISLSHIQDELKEQGVKMTFMELRLIASEIESGVFKAQEKKEGKNAPEQNASPKAEPADMEHRFDDQEAPVQDDDGVPFPRPPEEESDAMPSDAPAASADQQEKSKLRGKTTVTLNRIQRPGYIASGSVSFGSGASGDWVLDQTGSLGFERMDGKPDQRDIQEFQLELRKAFGA